jgi:hypothetical protein
MSTNPTSLIVTVCSDDIPLLLHHLEQMGIPQFLDAHFPFPSNWDGLSLGWTADRRLVYILSQAVSRLSHVQNWVVQHLETLKTCTGLPICDSNFADDRLSAILRNLNKDTRFSSL